MRDGTTHSGKVGVPPAGVMMVVRRARRQSLRATAPPLLSVSHRPQVQLSASKTRTNPPSFSPVPAVLSRRHVVSLAFLCVRRWRGARRSSTVRPRVRGVVGVHVRGGCCACLGGPPRRPQRGHQSTRPAATQPALLPLPSRRRIPLHPPTDRAPAQDDTGRGGRRTRTNDTRTTTSCTARASTHRPRSHVDSHPTALAMAAGESDDATRRPTTTPVVVVTTRTRAMKDAPAMKEGAGRTHCDPLFSRPPPPLSFSPGSPSFVVVVCCAVSHRCASFQVGLL